jgi:hypothetical protein
MEKVINLQNNEKKKVGDLKDMAIRQLCHGMDPKGAPKDIFSKILKLDLENEFEYKIAKLTTVVFQLEESGILNEACSYMLMQCIKEIFGFKTGGENE